MTDLIRCDKHGENLQACFTCKHVAEGYPVDIRLGLDPWGSWVVLCIECAKKVNSLTKDDLIVSCPYCLAERLKDIITSVEITKNEVVN